MRGGCERRVTSGSRSDSVGISDRCGMVGCGGWMRRPRGLRRMDVRERGVGRGE